jgi:hypothetical protein
MTYWTLGFLVGGLVVVVVAVLLFGIIQQATRIKAVARVAVELVDEIETNTRSVWALRDTNAVAMTILDGVQAIEANTGAIVEAVSATHVGRSAA